MSGKILCMANEVEIKFQIVTVRSLTRALQAAGFKLVTPSTHEFNTLYDLPGQKLRKRGELLRLRKYGHQWILTHKAKGTTARHKVRAESETLVRDGKQMDAILRALGFIPTFRYEKYRAGWNGGKGHVVIDKTPIGNYGEIEGPARWIDATARCLGIAPRDYITQTYAPMFFAWKRRTGSSAEEMTFRAVRRK
ncbi:MAG TPA: class IV adenylate cyclase [Terriglobales bacterium]|nr:class IV adenylate cyclase [Terriglobales bacterium]